MTIKLTLLADNGIQHICVSVFAYGQSGSGKTWSMLGGKADPGIIPRAVVGLFKRLRTVGSAGTQVFAAYMQLYGEKLEDLLADKQGPNPQVLPDTPTAATTACLRQLMESWRMRFRSRAGRKACICSHPPSEKCTYTQTLFSILPDI